jgi:type IV pilus assembly protein PilM
MNFYPPSIGIDISTSSIKIVSIKKGEDGHFDLIAFGKEYIPENTIVDGEIKDFKSVSKAFENIFSNSENPFPKTKYVVASLPEEEAFLRVFELPPIKQEEFSSALKFEIEANIPLSLDEVYYDYEIVCSQSNVCNCEVLVNAVPKKIVDSYINFFKQNNFKPLALEIESTATKRAILPCCDVSVKDTVLILDIGAVKTCFMIVAEGVLRFTSSNNIAGAKFSNALSEHFSLNTKEAEFMKRIVGLDNNQEKGKELLEILRPSLVMLKDQIMNYIDFFEMHPSRDLFSEEAKKVSRIVITGGGSCLWGIKDWFSRELGMEVVLGNSLLNIQESDSKVKMSKEDSFMYTTAIGLALRSFA